MANDRGAGCIVGLAVGDALGYPHEFRTVEQVRKEIGPEGITGFLRLQDKRFTRPFIVGTDHPPGTFTDDTQMSICVAEALLEAGDTVHSGSHDALMEAMARRFVAWFYGDKNDRSPGETTGIACKALRDGASWRASGVVASKGCGANMRVAPIGIYYDDLDVVADVARDCARITHAHPAALEGAAAAAQCVALAKRGAHPREMHAEVMKRCTNRGAPDFDEVFAQVAAVVDADAADVLVDRELWPRALGEGWVADEAIACALWCVWQHPDDYAKAVLLAANTDGDSDSIATIAGSISGARLGLDAIPPEWRRDVEDSAYLHELGARLER